MSKRQKRYQRLQLNPKSVAFDELRQVLEDFGFSLNTTSGSHHIFKHRLLNEALSVPFQRPVNSIYVKRALAMIDQIIKQGVAGKEPDDE